jgi:hypothetical protein
MTALNDMFTMVTLPERALESLVLGRSVELSNGLRDQPNAESSWHATDEQFSLQSYG